MVQYRDEIDLIKESKPSKFLERSLTSKGCTGVIWRLDEGVLTLENPQGRADLILASTIPLNREGVGRYVGS